jgi:anaerobic selenocysteine-containing dehydrogenase
VPEWTVIEAAMRQLRLTVAISTKLNRSHPVHGQQALILPALARSDLDMQASGRQSVTVEGSMSMVHASSGFFEPPSPHVKSEVAIICGIAKATLPDSGIDWDFFAADYDRIRDKIREVFPETTTARRALRGRILQSRDRSFDPLTPHPPSQARSIRS